MPQPGKHFVGREYELALLDEAWEDPKTHIVEFVAFGGVGKSALVANWLKEMQKEGWRGAACVLGHSFYSQGSRVDTQASADSFINEALQFFGDPDPTAGSPWDKGERLARLVRERPTLLILDGVEPLQLPGSGNIGGSGGQIRDPGLAALVRELAAGTNGLVVISTRVRIQHIEGWEDSSVRRVDLENLSAAAGAALLKMLGVTGTDEEREAACLEVKGHGLALNLLGTYLQKAFGGDIQKLDQVELFRADDKAGSHARHMMERYEGFLGESPELSIVRLLGLFDRPATMGEINALRAKPAIPGLTESLVELNEADWNYAVANLRNYELLANDSSTEKPTQNIEHFLDAHPLIREHFAAQLAEHHADAAREAHRRLYEHLKQSTPELPDNLKDMMPLYHAVAHGCKAGVGEETFRLVYDPRIQRSTEFFNVRKLGSFGTELATLSHFFDDRLRTPLKELPDELKAELLSQIAFDLQALGRLTEVRPAMQASVDAAMAQSDWKNAAARTSNLSELSLTLGDVSSAVRQGEQSVELADRSGDPFHRMVNRTTLADALHAVSRGRLSAEAFAEAEGMQKEMQPQYPIPYSLPGYRYCNLLLDELSELSDRQFASALGDREDTFKRELQQVRNRAETTLKWYGDDKTTGTLNFALDHLTLGRTWLIEARMKDESGRMKSGGQDSSFILPHSALDAAQQHLDESVALFRQAGHQDHLPRGLLQRAALWRAKFQIKSDESHIELAERDLSEAETIAKRGDMLTWRIEVALERTRLALARMKEEGGRMNEHMRDRAREKLEEARRLIKKTEKPYEPHVPDWDEWQAPEYVGVFKEGEIVGYHCRNDEMERLQKQIDSVEEQ